LDVGGGSGAFDIELCRLYPRMTATVYDLPLVAHIAAEKVEEAGLSDRIEPAAGDLFADARRAGGPRTSPPPLHLPDPAQDVRTVWFEAPGANGAVVGTKP